ARVLRTRRLAAERDIVGVTAKGGNIALHPAERLLDVQDAIVAERMALIVQRRMREEAQEAQAVVQRDDYRGAPQGSPRRELAPVVVVGGAVHIAAAVDPDQDRVPAALLVAVSHGRREDVEIKAVLGEARRARKYPEGRHLGAGVRIGRGV